MRLRLFQFTMNAYAESYMRIYWHRLSFDKVCWKNLQKAIVRIAKETCFSIKQITYKDVVLWLAAKQVKRTGDINDLMEYQELRLMYR